MRNVAVMLLAVLAIVLTGCAGVLRELQPEQEPAPSPEKVRAAARAGDPQAAFLAYRMAHTKGERRKWVCIAANRGIAEAQAEIARLHWRAAGIFTSPFERDPFVSYVWSIIAINRGEPLNRTEALLAQVLDEGERQRAIQLAEAWQPDPAQCDDMEGSEYFHTPADGGL